MATICKCGCGKELSEAAVMRGWAYVAGHKKQTDRPTLPLKSIRRGGGFADAIAQLRAQRDAIDKAIAALENI